MHELLRLAFEHQDEVVEYRRYLHRHPEVAFEEKETSAYLRQQLTEAGIAWKPVGDAILAEINGEKPSSDPKTLVLRADMDALPIKEETGLPYCSEVEGKMHACGHDLHMAMLLTAGKLLNGLKTEFSGKLLLAFQPAEEMVCGAHDMIEADPFMDSADYVIGTHVMTDLPTGTIGLRKGGLFFGGERFQIYIDGKEGHGARPHTATDALLAGNALVMNAQSLLARETDAFDSAVCTICTFQAGSACNVIAGSAYLNGTTRFLNEPRRNALKTSLDRITEMTAQAFGCTGRVDWDHYVPAVENDAEMDELVRKSLGGLLGGEALREAPQYTVSDDFSWFQMKTKGYYMVLGCGNGDEAHASPHTPQFIPDEGCLPIGVASYLKLALDLLN
jgi:amidohydrolase